MGDSAPHAVRIRKKILANIAKPSGVGSKVSEETLIQAARVYLDQEDKNGKVSALAVGKALGGSVAPEWLVAERFTRILEVERFKRKVLMMQARPEIGSLIQEVIDLGLLEAHKRLVLSPGEIPNSSLFGDILHKLPKMVREWTDGAAPVKAGDVFISIVKEINLMADPVERERTRQLVLGQYQRVAQAMSPDAETVDAPDNDLLRDGAGVPTGTTVPLLAESPVPSISGDISSDSILWSDPAVD